MTEKQKLEQAVEALKSMLSGFVPLISITLGTGLGYMVELLEEADHIFYTQIPNCPVPSVQGHSGELWWGKLKGVPVIMLSGRVHCYEGRSIHEVVFMTRLMMMLGIERLIITHATGALTKNLEPGDVVGIRGQIGLTCDDPTSGPGIDELGDEPFVGMGKVFDPDLLKLAKRCALKLGVPFARGVSVFKNGRTYEEESETFAMRAWGADVATMSTVADVMAIAQRRRRVLDLALVTDWCPGLGDPDTSHEEVQRVAAENKGPFGRLIVEIVYEMGQIT